MEDFRFLEDNGCWIIIIILFLLLLGNKDGCGNFNLLDNFFGGCNNSSWMWIIIIILIWFFCFRDKGCGVFRNEIQ